MRKAAYISLGGNQGDIPKTFQMARKLLEMTPDITIDRLSCIYRTEPQGDPDQPWFLNQVARLRCALTIQPVGLLHRLQDIEVFLGRIRDPSRRFGPRTIDLDLLLFDSVVCSTEDLVLPHPRMCERAFVLVPLLELEANLRLPDGTKVADILERLHYTPAGIAVYQMA